MGTIVKKYCKCMTSLVFQENRFFGLITRNLLYKHQLLGCSFCRVNHALIMHTSPGCPSWRAPTGAFAVPGPLISSGTCSFYNCLGKERQFSFNALTLSTISNMLSACLPEFFKRRRRMLVEGLNRTLLLEENKF